MEWSGELNVTYVLKKVIQKKRPHNGQAENEMEGCCGEGDSVGGCGFIGERDLFLAAQVLRGPLS